MSEKSKKNRPRRYGQYSARYRWLRHQAGNLSQYDFADAIRVSRQHVSRCEQGHSEYSHSELERISRALKMPLAWVVEQDEAQPGIHLADWLPHYFRLHTTARRMFDVLAKSALELTHWRG